MHDRESTGWVQIGLTLARIEYKIDRMAHYMTRSMLRSPPSAPTSRQQRKRAWWARAYQYCQPILATIAEKLITIVFAYLAPVMGGMWLLGAKRMAEYWQWLETLLRLSGG